MENECRDLLADYARLAAAMASAPIGAVSFLHNGMTHYLGREGLAVSEVPAEQAFCTHTLRMQSPFLLSNALRSNTYKDSPLVVEGPRVLAYAGFPLRLTAGEKATGVLAVMDSEPRRLQPHIRAALSVLARRAEGELRLRLAAAGLEDGLAEGDGDDPVAREEAGAAALLPQIVELIRDLAACGSTDELCREAVERSRQALGLERAAIFLRKGRAFRGTHGTDRNGRTVAERHLEMPFDPQVVRLEEQAIGRVPAFLVRDDWDEHWRDGKRGAVGEHWQALTPLPDFDDLSAVFVNDAARSGTPFDPGRQDAVVVFCQLLGQLLARRAAEEQAEEVRREKTRLLANVSHDFRAPINGIRGMADLLANSGLQGAALGYAQTMRESCEQMLSRIQSLPDYTAEPEPGQAPAAQVNAFDLRMLLREALRVVESSAHAKSLPLLYEVDGNLAERYRGDAGRVREILLNLLDNAIKYTDDGMVELSVRCEEAEESRHLLAFSVRDTGPGLSSEQLARIFTPSRDERQATDQFAAQGIGLITSQELAQWLGGEIACESREGNGATFTLTVPMEAVEADAAQA